MSIFFGILICYIVIFFMLCLVVIVIIFMRRIYMVFWKSIRLASNMNDGSYRNSSHFIMEKRSYFEGICYSNIGWRNLKFWILGYRFEYWIIYDTYVKISCDVTSLTIVYIELLEMLLYIFYIKKIWILYILSDQKTKRLFV